MLNQHSGKLSAPDILDLLFTRERRPSGREMWRNEDPSQAIPLEEAELVKLGWYPNMDAKETLPLLGTARAAAFRTLSSEEQAAWTEKAHNYVVPEPTK